MKKLLTGAIITSALIFSTNAHAANEHNFCRSNEHLCFSSEELMKEVVKETINVVGKHLMEKYLDTDKHQNNTNNNNAPAANTNNRPIENAVETYQAQESEEKTSAAQATEVE